jgi:hypothetical protein
MKMQLFCPPPISIIRVLILCPSDNCSFEQCAYLCPVLLLQISDYCPTDRFEKVPYKPESLVTKILWEKNARGINAQAYA